MNTDKRGMKNFYGTSGAICFLGVLFTAGLTQSRRMREAQGGSLPFPVHPASAGGQVLTNCQHCQFANLWAWLIANGFKDVENRGRRINYRGPLLIHAALNLESCSKENIKALNEKFRVEIPLALETGGIVGMATVIDCAITHNSRWYVEGSFAWVLENAQPVEFQQCKGSLGLFKPQFKTDNVMCKQRNL
ncbi:MAG: hypothetical protein JWR26_1032 [Pedosphaera sp.]|nr:hypothetical protein [Pedosphaera sp.]